MLQVLKYDTGKNMQAEEEQRHSQGPPKLPAALSFKLLPLKSGNMSINVSVMDSRKGRKIEEFMASTRKQAYFAQYLKTIFNYKTSTH